MIRIQIKALRLQIFKTMWFLNLLKMISLGHSKCLGQTKDYWLQFGKRQRIKLERRPICDLRRIFYLTQNMQNLFNSPVLTFLSKLHLVLDQFLVNLLPFLFHFLHFLLNLSTQNLPRFLKIFPMLISLFLHLYLQVFLSLWKIGSLLWRSKLGNFVLIKSRPSPIKWFHWEIS